jgi:hypothetical protein
MSVAPLYAGRWFAGRKVACGEMGALLAVPIITDMHSRPCVIWAHLTPRPSVSYPEIGIFAEQDGRACVHCGLPWPYVSRLVHHGRASAHAFRSPPSGIARGINVEGMLSLQALNIPLRDDISWGFANGCAQDRKASDSRFL